MLLHEYIFKIENVLKPTDQDDLKTFEKGLID